jgi:DNA-directed RNA polymerase subunit RPC12/RpoP
MITFLCDNCGEPISVAEQHAGKKGKCKRCNAVVSVPAVREKPDIFAKCITCSEVVQVKSSLAGSMIECESCSHGLVYVQDLPRRRMERRHQSCESCKWASWRETSMWNKEASSFRDSLDEMTGLTTHPSEDLPHRVEAECRRFPPSVVVDISSSSDGTLEIYSSTTTAFPRVFARHWCGEWASVEPPDAPGE